MRGRSVFLALRIVALLFVVLLLWNPSLPGGAVGGAHDQWVILDGSRSMAGTTVEGQSIWDWALNEAQERHDAGWGVMVSSPGPLPVAEEDLEGLVPVGSSSNLTEALVAVAEAGGTEVLLLTDRRISDPLSLTEAARRLGLALETPLAPDNAPNLGVESLTVPSVARSGERVTVRAMIGGDGGFESPDGSVSVVLSMDGREVGRTTVPVPGQGALSEATWEFAVPPGTGPRRVEATLDQADGFQDDNRRLGIVRVDPEETGILLVSFGSDWEHRYLFPVLQDVTGLPTQGYLSLGEDRFTPIAEPTGAAVDADGLIRRIERAELVVLLGEHAVLHPRVDAALDRVGRLLVVPSGPEAAEWANVRVANPSQGEWYVAEVPPSPIAGALPGLLPDDLPPLSGFMAPEEQVGRPALLLSFQGTGTPEPGFLLHEDARQKRAIALAQGMWRWASRGGASADTYRSLWSAVGGWLLEDAPSDVGQRIRPLRSVAVSDLSMEWLTGEEPGGRVAVRIEDGGELVALDTVFVVDGSGRFLTPPLPSGAYTYQSWSLESTQADTVAGSFDVEPFTDDMLLGAIADDRLTVAATDSPRTDAATRPFRTSPLPYLLILAILCGEWAGRRRMGLR